MALQRRLDLRQGRQAAALPQPRTTTPWRSTIRIEARVLRLVWSKIGSSTSAAASAWGSAAGAGRRGRPLGQDRRAAQVDAGRLGR
jgi:hypothetical protein